jgi:hypothetical protein
MQRRHQLAAPCESHEVTENHHYDDDVIEAIDGEYDIDIGIDTIQANINNQHPPGSRMPFGCWKSLPQETQAIWDTIPDKDKATILGSGKGNTGSYSRGTRPTRAQSNRMSDAERLAAYLHELGIEEVPPETPANEVPIEDIPPDTDDPGTTLLANATKRTWSKPKGSDLPPSDIRKVLSSIKHHDSSTQESVPEITINGKTYRIVNTTTTYNVSAARHRSEHALLVDRGVNGGVAGEDVRVLIFKSMRSVDIQGLDNHQVTNIPIVTAGGVVKSQRGNVIAILHQYAYIGHGRTIHSSGQLEWYQNDINDRSIKVQGGLQRITTLD